MNVSHFSGFSFFHFISAVGLKVQEEVPLEVLAKWFGHKDTSMLRTIYVHLLDETRDEWSEREKGLGGQNGGQK